MAKWGSYRSKSRSKKTSTKKSSKKRKSTSKPRKISLRRYV